jgi:hypothetical protein
MLPAGDKDEEELVEDENWLNSSISSLPPAGSIAGAVYRKL